MLRPRPPAIRALGARACLAALVAAGAHATAAGAQPPAPPVAAPPAGAPTAWLREINRDVWLPFMRGVAENVDSLYLSVHSRDYVRVQQAQGLILDYDDYVDDTRPIMADLRARGTRLRLTVRFDARVADGRYASERGVLEVVATPAAGPPRTSYARFHVVSRREGSAWRMLTEVHGGDGAPAGAAEFERARAVDDVAPFGCATVYPARQPTCGE